MFTAELAPMSEPADGQLDLGTACASRSRQVSELMCIRKFGNPPSTCGPIGGVPINNEVVT